MLWRVCCLPCVCEAAALRAAVLAAVTPACVRSYASTPLAAVACCRVNVEAWGPLAERADAVLQKGDRVAVQVCTAAACVPGCCMEAEHQLRPWSLPLACAVPVVALAAAVRAVTPGGLDGCRARPTLRACTCLSAQGRLRLNKWEDASGTKRTAWKITANSISKVRSNYPAAGGAGSFDEYGLPAASSASVPGPAPWDLPAEPAAAPAGEQPWDAQHSKQLQSAEDKWCDFFEDTSSEWRCAADRPQMRCVCASLWCGAVLLLLSALARLRVLPELLQLAASCVACFPCCPDSLLLSAAVCRCLFGHTA